MEIWIDDKSKSLDLEKIKMSIRRNREIREARFDEYMLIQKRIANDLFKTSTD